MAVSYKKLWIRLLEKDMTKQELMKAAGFAPNTLTKLNKNEYVALPILDRICSALECDFGDVVEHTEG